MEPTAAPAKGRHPKLTLRTLRVMLGPEGGGTETSPREGETQGRRDQGAAETWGERPLGGETPGRRDQRGGETWGGETPWGERPPWEERPQRRRDMGVETPWEERPGSRPSHPRG